MQTSNVETLLVGGELDFATPPQSATKELLPHLPNGHQVVLPGFGHTNDFWTYQPEASTHLLNTFLASGKVDDSLYVAQKVDFTPEVTQTALGKGLAGSDGRPRAPDGALAAADGPPGHQARALRAQGERDAALGLRGRARPGRLVPRRADRDHDDAGRRRSTTSCWRRCRSACPVGLGIYLAWVHRDWPAQSKAVGLVAAAGGALAGAWLGFHAATDLLALVTAIAGAIAGANLALILLDVSRGRSTGSGPVTAARRRSCGGRRPSAAGAQARSAATSRS